MVESILDTVKTMVGVDKDDDAFDTDLIISINTVISELAQLGVRKQGDFLITGPEETWEDYLGNQNAKLVMVKSYIPMKVRLMWDPPQSGSFLSAMEEQVKELSFRISITVDPEEGGTNE